MNVHTLKRLTPLVMLALLTLAVLLPVVPTGAMVITNSPLNPGLPFDKLTNRRDEDFAAIDRYIEDEMRARASHWRGKANCTKSNPTVRAPLYSLVLGGFTPSYSFR